MLTRIGKLPKRLHSSSLRASLRSKARIRLKNLQSFLGPETGPLRDLRREAPPESEDNQSDLAGQELLMGYCHQIPASAWQQLEGAQWPKLTKVDFEGRLGFWAPVGVCVVSSRWLLGCEGGCGSGRGGRHPAVSQERSNKLSWCA